MKKSDILGSPFSGSSLVDAIIFFSTPIAAGKNLEIYQMPVLKDKRYKIQSVAEQEAEMKLSSSFPYGLNHLVQ